MQAKRLSIDTSFKRVHGRQEFEFESWDVAHMNCYWHSSFHDISTSTRPRHHLLANIRDCQRRHRLYCSLSIHPLGKGFKPLSRLPTHKKVKVK
ncbi:uncharacterized protein EDB91DRAFT_1146849, partial [Suillus paluster]|uniref:uncharacterized protein n=1 Tax=Suillus paluster TaxID=48578 RepID=UPI001B85ED0A